MIINGKALWDDNWTYKEVWYSKSKFTRDDAVSKGFIKLPKNDGNFGEHNCRAWLKERNVNGRVYELSAISTNLTQHWDKQQECPDFKE